MASSCHLLKHYIHIFVAELCFFPEPTILLDKSPIKDAKETKFLGLIFDSKLTFKTTYSTYKFHVKKKSTGYCTCSRTQIVELIVQFASASTILWFVANWITVPLFMGRFTFKHIRSITKVFL